MFFSNDMQNSFDWNLFWNAFGAIGTTIGSLVTAVAVIVAVKQYKQPLQKRIDVELWYRFLMEEHSLVSYHVKIMNTGIRPIILSNVYLYFKVRKRIILLDRAIPIIEELPTFPRRVEPEENIDFYIDANEFNEIISKNIREKKIFKYDKIIFVAEDSHGKKYFSKKGIKVWKTAK